MKKLLHYTISEIIPYINWIYFHHAWGVSGNRNEQERLENDARAMLAEMQTHYKTHALLGLFDANGDGDDLIVDDVRIPLLRQQHDASSAESPNLCLADFVRPLSSALKDKVGVFATTVDASLENDYNGDGYLRMMAQTLADRLAEATAEKLHEATRTRWWGYAPNENLSIKELHQERFQGIRPAIGYPSLPDASVNFLIDRLLGLKQIGIRLTESGAMKPHASVSGFMFAHPQARYFSVGRISEEQFRDYARRRGVPVELLRRFLASNLR